MHLLGTSTNPDGRWTTQQIRNLVRDLGVASPSSGSLFEIGWAVHRVLRRCSCFRVVRIPPRGPRAPHEHAAHKRRTTSGTPQASGATTSAAVRLWVQTAIDRLIVLISTTSSRSCRPILRATQQPLDQPMLFSLATLNTTPASVRRSSLRWKLWASAAKGMWSPLPSNQTR